MTTDELDEKWRELVAAGKAKWSPGMLGPDGFRITAVHRDTRRGLVLVTRGAGWTAPSLQSDFLPDWDDPATLGCLLGQVRERWNDPVLSATACYVKDRVMKWGMDHPCLDSLPDALWDYFPTEAEALLAALEAAP